MVRRSGREWEITGEDGKGCLKIWERVRESNRGWESVEGGGGGVGGERELVLYLCRPTLCKIGG